ncbi:diflavin oxidoreductase [Herbiconiux sp. YIM B11900]|uniref:diflavin oxidoreductase n=1 Tax=Herbiconiux sp. YIM B11900 TaxID=3404131 RepID=UPI003F82DBB3
MNDTQMDQLTILFGSQTGNAEYLAHQIHGKAVKAGNEVGLASMEDWLQAGRPDVKRLLVVTSTHDNGHMPDNAAEFWDYLQGLEVGSLEGLPYAVLSIGDSMYDDFCKAGHDIDTRLEELGAVRVVESVDCDIDFEFSAGRWAGPAVEALLAAEGWEGMVPVSAEPAGAGRPVAAEERHLARIAESRRLSQTGSEKSVMHYEFSFEDSSFDYEPGDSLAIYPTNPDGLVEEWVKHFGDPDVPSGDSRRPLRDVLREEVELRLPHPGLVVGLSEMKPGSDAIGRVIQMIQSGDRERLDSWFWGRDVLDVLTVLGCLDLPISDILAELRPLQHRDYSISSSPRGDDGRVHITVSEVGYPGHRGAYQGAATRFLTERADDGDVFAVRRLPAHEFRLPAEDVPVIMIGPGVGVAPFRAFLRHRRATGASGRNWLFFGDQHREYDWLYEDEFAQYQTEGLLTTQSVAFSRDQAQKHYVQDEMLRSRDELLDWIDAGAYVFVCGDKTRMAPDVDRALMTILAREGAVTDGAAALSELKSANRYVKDVY